MSRKSKIDALKKVKIVEQYLNGEITDRDFTRRSNIRIINLWGHVDYHSPVRKLSHVSNINIMMSFLFCCHLKHVIRSIIQLIGFICINLNF